MHGSEFALKFTFFAAETSVFRAGAVSFISRGFFL